MTSLSIGDKQGFTQALKEYAKNNNLKASDGSEITQAEWDATIVKLKSIQDARANAQPKGASIFKSDVNIIKKGNVEFSDAEFKEILTAMGLSSETAVTKTVDKNAPASGVTPSVIDKTTQAVGATPPASSASPESKTGVSFDKWSKDGYKSVTNGEDLSKVKDLRFVEDDYDKALEAKDDKATKEAYKKGLYNLTNQHIKSADTSGDSKISLDEYIAKEVADQQSVNSEFKLKHKTKRELKKSFKNVDVNGDGSLSKEELASVYGVYDLDEKGKMNGRISFSAFANFSAQMGTKSFADVMNRVYGMFFGQ